MTKREKTLNALAAIHYAGWRWFANVPPHASEKRMVALFPPELPGFVRWNFRPEWFEDVTGREGEFERFHDWDRAGGRHEVGVSIVEGPPDYLHSLDACASFEAVIAERGEDAMREYYRQIMLLLTDYKGGFRLLTAPATLRVEAALRSAGLWPEEEGKP